MKNKNEIIGIFINMHGTMVQDVVDILQKILEKDPGATFNVDCGPHRHAQLSVDYKEGPSVEAAEQACTDNRNNIHGVTICGCFGCLSIFRGGQILDWVGTGLTTAICPFCETPQVIPDIEDAQYLVDVKEYYTNNNFNKFAVYGALDLGRG